VIPRGTNTLSKGRWPEPFCVVSGCEAIVSDVEGNEFLDWTASLGPVILGYGHPAVNEAIQQQLEYGIVFPSPLPLEAEVAERIIDLCPGVEAVRLGKTGSDAVAAAVRCARAYTGNDLVLCDVGYHGWHDWFAMHLPYKRGIPDQYRNWSWRWSGKLQPAWLDRSAALVIEPDRYSIDDLAEIQLTANYYGCLVIWDEVVCGFRAAPGGWREVTGLQPDLSCYGKAIANGMPVSAVGGSWEVMAPFQQGMWSTTHGGETLSLAAAKATLDVIGDGTVLKAINKRGELIAEGLGVSCAYGARVHVDLTDEQIRKLMDRGVLTNGDLFGMAAHTNDHALYTVQSINDVTRTVEP
jgi:glutamate-1-semialdehyde aminotransferase